MNADIFWLLILFAGLLAGIMSGTAVVLVLAGVPVLVGSVAAVFGQFDVGYFAAFPQRVLGIMNNPLLIAIPLFVAMGILLEQSRQAEKMLVHLSKLMGQTRSTMVLAVLFVSTLIAASTGIIGATIVMLGVISLPAMLNAGVPARSASGLVCAAGTLGQIIPPSIVLILLGDQISNAYIEAQQIAGNFAPDPVSVGDLFAGALVPGLILVAVYAAYMLVRLRFAGGDGAQVPQPETKSAPHEHLSIITLIADILPPVLLIVAVLGSILLGVATPTEAAAIGVAGTLLIAAANIENAPAHLRAVTIAAVAIATALAALQQAGLTRLDFTGGTLKASPWAMLAIALTLAEFAALLYSAYWLARARQLLPAAARTVEITAMVFGIIIAASMLALVFRGFDGDEIVQGLFENLPGGEWGMLLVTMLVIFLLGFVLEFVEIIFIVIPIVGPIILQGDFHPVWFAVLIALNIQTSFLTPPFGFALFYFRSVAPAEISTRDIYVAVAPFVLLQIAVIGLILAVPSLATWLPSKLF